jgi:hypothetical protein
VLSCDNTFGAVAQTSASFCGALDAWQGCLIRFVLRYQRHRLLNNAAQMRDANWCYYADFRELSINVG